MNYRTALAVVILVASSSLGVCQTYPNKTVRIIVSYAPGGATDLLARTVAQKLNDAWGRPVVVENRVGAGGNIGTEYVARSQPDGYTMVMAINAHTINASLYEKLPYDPFKDFQPLSLVATSPHVLVSHPALPARTVPDLIKLAKARPGQLTNAHAGTGSGSHLAGVLFGNMAGVKIVHVPYKGATPAILDVIGGHVDVCFSVISVADPHIKARKLRAIAVTSLNRSRQYPDLPSISEAALKGYEVISWFGLLLPANTPKDVVAMLHTEVVRITKLTDVQQKISVLGIELVGSTPEEFGSFMRADAMLWDKVIKANGIRLE